MAGVNGAMVSVGLSEEEAKLYIDRVSQDLGPGDLTIACINSPKNVTISGNRKSVEELTRRMEQASIFARILRVPVAYHGPHMELVSNEYLDSIGPIIPRDAPNHPHVNMVSSVTGQRISNVDLCNPSYWVQNMVSPVRFADAIQTTFSEARKRLPNKLDLSHQNVVWATDILELGPHATLSGPIRDSLRPILQGRSIDYNSVLMRKKNASLTFLNAIAQLHCRGYPVQLSSFDKLPMKGHALPISLPNLPQYPFNHTKSFWFESRIGKGIRFRKHGRNAFLGSPVADWNPLDARWRHFLRPNDSHWIGDHKINGSVLFPAAGMLTMAVEAALQLAGPSDVSAFELSDCTFHSALELPIDSEGVEVQFQIVPRNSSTTKQSLQYDWWLRAYQTDWTEVCRGTIRTVFANAVINDVDNANEESHLLKHAVNHYHDIAHRCSSEIGGQDLYSRLWQCGYNFGPSFTRIQMSKHSASGEATAEVEVLDPHVSELPTVIHPATLDGILQIMLPGITEGGKDSKFATSLPTRINKLWLSRRGLLRTDRESVNVAVKIKKNGFRNTTSDIAALSKDSSLLIFVNGIETTSITDGLDTSELSHSTPRLCWNITFKPDIQFMDPTSLRTYLTQGAPIRAASSQYYNDIDLVLQMFIKKALSKLNALDIKHFSGHIQHYHQWMMHQVHNTKVDTLDGPRTFESDKARIDFYHLVRGQDPKHSRIYYRAGEHLVNVLSGKSDPLALLFQGNDMPDFYDRLLETSDYMTPLERYLDLLVHKDPSMSILEVGAGTGGATKHIMKTIAQNGSSGRTAKYSKYCFTDVSPSFFEKAETVFSGFPKMHFQTLNIEEDPLAQGFEPESFDLIVASLVLHATASVHQTLSNLRKLLKVGGKLVAIEVTEPNAPRAGFVFGLLPGWWLSESSHQSDRLSPCLTPPEWHEVLISSGFSGVDHVFWDTQDDEHRLLSLLISSKVDDKQQQVTHTVSSALIVSPDKLSATHITTCRQQLELAGLACSVSNLADLTCTDDMSSKLVVILDSSHRPLLQSFTEQQFGDIRQTLVRARNVLWISQSSGHGASNPSTGSVYGLARALRSENETLNFTVFETNLLLTPEHQHENLRKVINQCLSASNSTSFEPEIVEKDGLLHVPRAIEDIPLNQRISDQGVTAIQRKVRFSDGNLRLTVQTPGLLDSLIFTHATPLPLDLGPNEVEVCVKAIGVNFKDCLVALGRVSDDTLGTECAGIVARVGTSCRIRPGERVVVSALDTYRGTVRCNEALVVKIPDSISFTEAAKLPTNFVTAYHALVELGRISEGDSVLIHAGAGGTGQAAIQIAQCFGAEVFVTVGSQQKKNLVKSLYKIPDDHIFYSRDTSFAQGVKNATGGRGVDLILNSLAGNELRASWECIAPYGRFLEIGKRDIFSHEKLPMFQFAQNVTFSAIDIAAMTTQRPKLIQKALQAVVDLLVQKKISVASPLKVFSLHEVENAFRYLQSGINSGGVAIAVDEDTVVQVNNFKAKMNDVLLT
jgi:NADPH:quinone reductase-like Zn-dependent oxidoreductase/ubiquinone/menaquinone biosynthesis C-methylase UbiE